MSVQPDWVGTKEASERLGITLRTLYRLIDEGEIPAYKIGRVIRLKEHEIDAYIAAARVTPGDLTHLYPDRIKLESSDDSSGEDGLAVLDQRPG